MAIPEAQLETWSYQGSITQSSATYNAIKKTLEANETPYSGKNYEVFLQGSYGNDTNIYSESDVDIVIRLRDCFQHDLSRLSDEEQAAFKTAHSDATYRHKDFKTEVLQVLTDCYGDDVIAGQKAIAIAASGNRRKADVITAIQYRRYHRFRSLSDQNYEEGICFVTGSGQLIANYPCQHSANLTSKHQTTNAWFKPMARVLKNVRSRLVSDGLIESGVAPSYYLEGLLYNVPAAHFGPNYASTFINAINWIMTADRSVFVCANEQYYLLREGSPVTWRTEQCDQFLDAVVEFWQQW